MLGYAASLLQVPEQSLSNALLFRVINTGTAGGRRSTYNVPQNALQVHKILVGLCASFSLYS